MENALLFEIPKMDYNKIILGDLYGGRKIVMVYHDMLKLIPVLKHIL